MADETAEEKAEREKREAEEAAAAEKAKKPPWGSDEEFDPARAWKKIQAVEGDKDKLRSRLEEVEGKLKEREDAEKSEQQKLEEGKSSADERAKTAEAEAARLRVALKKGLDETQAKRLVGDDEAALEKDADELLASFKKEDDDEDNKPPSRPKERLRSGAASGKEPEDDSPAALAEQVSRSW